MVKAWPLLLFLLLPLTAAAQQSPRMLAKPKQGYVLDKAGILSSQAKTKIDAISKQSSKQSGSPIYVVTIPSLASVHAFDVESYANELFDAWRIGTKQLNKGILLLIAKSDRKARIALGKDWRYTRDGECQQIMNEEIVPHFKAGDYSQGVIDGAKALSEMAKNPVPQQTEEDDGQTSYPVDSEPAASSVLAPMGGGLVVLPFMVCLCPFGMLVLLIVKLASMGNGGGNKGSTTQWYSTSSTWNQHNSGSGFGGFSGSNGGGISSSSSGGGSSGGGGATGSW